MCGSAQLALGKSKQWMLSALLGWPSVVGQCPHGSEKYCRTCEQTGGPIVLLIDGIGMQLELLLFFSLMGIFIRLM